MENLKSGDNNNIMNIDIKDIIDYIPFFIVNKKGEYIKNPKRIVAEKAIEKQKKRKEVIEVTEKGVKYRVCFKGNDIISIKEV